MGLGLAFDEAMTECRDCGSVYEVRSYGPDDYTTCPVCCPDCYGIGTRYAGEGRPRRVCTVCGGTGKQPREIEDDGTGTQHEEELR